MVNLTPGTGKNNDKIVEIGKGRLPFRPCMFLKIEIQSVYPVLSADLAGKVHANRCPDRSSICCILNDHVPYEGCGSLRYVVVF